LKTAVTVTIAGSGSGGLVLGSSSSDLGTLDVQTTNNLII